MSHNDFVRPGNMFPATCVPVAKDFRTLDNYQSQSLDGANGGAYAPLKEIIVGNAGVKLSTAGSLVSGGVSTRRGGRLRHGNNDHVTFTTPRTRTELMHLTDPSIPNFATSEIEPGGSGLYVNGYGSLSGIQIFQLPRRFLHNGATWTTATLRLRVGQLHAAVPATLPQFAIVRSDGASLYSGLFAVLAAPADAPSYFAGGNAQSIVLTVDQNATVDVTQFSYALWVNDETGANALKPSNNIYHSLTLAYSGISDMKFE